MNPITWHDVIGCEKKKPYFKGVSSFIEDEIGKGKVIYPLAKNIFNAFRYTAFSDIKVVILGQDPYHGPNQAHGLCFSVFPGVKTPPSLANIYKELSNSIPGFTTPEHGYLKSWAEQGVLLLNTVLTVEQGKAHSHSKCGWEIFTKKVIEVINEHLSGVVFLLWGAHAQRKGSAIDCCKHHVLMTSHPSPLSAHRGFLGCGHFDRTNQILIKQDQEPIDWYPALGRMEITS